MDEKQRRTMLIFAYVSIAISVIYIIVILFLKWYIGLIIAPAMFIEPVKALIAVKKADKGEK